MHEPMDRRRTSRALSVAVVASVALVFALAYIDLRREQARALDDFTGEQAALARTLAATMSARVSAVLRDLDTLAALEHPAPALLEQLAAGYRGLGILDHQGRIVQQVHLIDENSAPHTIMRVEYLFETAPRDGGVVVSDRSGGGRMFLRRDAHGAVVLLVDTERFFEGMREAAFAAAPAPMRLLVMDDQHRWVIVGSEPTETTSELDRLLAEMARGEAGTAFLSRPSAASSGAPRSPASRRCRCRRAPGRSRWSPRRSACAIARGWRRGACWQRRQ